jgi:hypothetical protein
MCRQPRVCRQALAKRGGRPSQMSTGTDSRRSFSTTIEASPLFFGTSAFAPIEVNWPSPMDRHNCAWGEAGGDGRPDLLCTQGAKGWDDGSNEVWTRGSSGWHEAGAPLGLDAPRARGRSVTWLDYNRTGRLDAFIGDIEREGHGDVLYRNDGDGIFVPVDAGASGVRRTRGATVADWTRNGWQDLLLLQAGAPPVALENRGGHFVEVDLGLSTRDWLHATFGDFDGDGWIDLHLLTRPQSLILRNDRGTFHPVDERRVRAGEASAWLDIDNTGRLDLYVVQSAPGPDPGSRGDRPDFLLRQAPDGSFWREGLPETQGWEGAGDAVAVFDHNRNGRLDVLVSNGRARHAGRHHLMENIGHARNSAAIILRGASGKPAWPWSGGSGRRRGTPSPGPGHRWCRRSQPVRARLRASGAGRLRSGMDQRALAGRLA